MTVNLMPPSVAGAKPREGRKGVLERCWRPQWLFGLTLSPIKTTKIDSFGVKPTISPAQALVLTRHAPAYGPAFHRDASEMTPAELRAFFAAYKQPSTNDAFPTLEFYGHSHGPHRSFSNFFEHEPFAFTVPAACNRDALLAAGRPETVSVTYTEKAIMLCKAALMGDFACYDQIATADDPRKAKSLGRQVAPWNQALWEEHVCEVASAVVLQKFASVPGLSALLLSTGGCVIAEMTRNDRNWGTGLDVGHADASRPAQWRGTNILGWALMEARTTLRDRQVIDSRRTARLITAAGNAAAEEEGESSPSKRPKRAGRLQSAYVSEKR